MTKKFHQICFSNNFLSKFIICFINVLTIFFFVIPQFVNAATINNNGDKPITIIVAEGVQSRNYTLEAKSQIVICLKGCFLTYDNNRYAVKGTETININDVRINFTP